MAVTGLRPRVRPWLRRVAIVAFVLLVPVALWTAWDYAEARRLARLVSEIKARGEPVSSTPGYADYHDGADTAGRYYEAAAALVETGEVYGPLGLLNRLSHAEGDRTPFLGEIRTLLARNRDAEQYLARATDVEFQGYRAGFDYSYRFDRLVRLGFLADLRAIERVMSGDGDGAATALVQELQLLRPGGWSATWQDSDLLGIVASSVLRRVAARTSAILTLRPSPPVLGRLQQTLESFDQDAAIERSLIGERGMLLQMFWSDANQWYASPLRSSATPERGLAIRPAFARLLVRRVEVMNELLPTTRKPWPDRLRVDAPTDPEMRAFDRTRSFFWYMLSADSAEQAVRYAHKRRTEIAAANLAVTRSAIVAVAVQRCSLEHGGVLPASLSELVPDYLTALPIDPYSGTSLRYTVDDRRFAVYSLGTNERDDGARELPGMWAGYQSNRPAADIGVEVARARVTSGGAKP